MFEVECETGFAPESDEGAGDLGLPAADGVIPSGLDEIPPGPYLAVILSSLDRSRLSGHDLVVVLRAEARMTAYFQALSYQSMVEVTNRTIEIWGDCSEIAELAPDEIRAALSLTRRSADLEMAFAHALEENPRVWEALSVGAIDLRRARVIIDAITGLGDDQASEVVHRVIGQAPSMTTGELRALIGRLVIETDPQAARTRYEETVQDRRVFSEVNPAGTFNLMGLDLDTVRAQTARNRINTIARSLKTKDETRTLDQIRADVFLDLLCGTNHDTQGSGSVNIAVELATLANLADKAGEIPGVGPVIADIARQVTYEQQDGTWKYVVTHQGRPVATGTTRRRPTKAMTRHLQAAYPVCVFPGCRMPATDVGSW
jgi:hypothetical protein